MDEATDAPAIANESHWGWLVIPAEREISNIAIVAL